MVHESSFFDVATVGMPEHARMDKDVVAERIHGSKPVFITSMNGETALVTPNADRNTPNRDHPDGVAVWGCTDTDHPEGGYTRVRLFGDGDPATVPLGTLARMAVRRVRSLLF